MPVSTSDAAFAAPPLTGAAPPEAPMAMPTQNLDGVRFETHEPGHGWRLAALLACAFALTLYALGQMYALAAHAGVSPLEWLSFLFFAPSFLWISAASLTALAGACVLLTAPRRARNVHRLPSSARTAIVFPVYHEQIGDVIANAEAVYDSLRQAGAHSYEVFFLSDSVDPAFAQDEAAAMRELARRRPGAPFFYRRRLQNHGRKSGNIADFIRRWGARYEYMIVFDADSMMSAPALIELVARMEASPRTALIQTVPVIINSRTRFARVQQFALRAAGPMFGAGLAWWSGSAGNYWGHNAILRTRAFASCAGLPHLEGPAPFGGTILSHDFIEAAMLRRAGWRIEIAADIEGSYEQCPPTLTDLAARDRRWAQGSMQHIAIVGAHGFDWVSRVHIIAGIMGYASSALWCLLLATSVALGFAAQFEPAAPYAQLETPWVFNLHDPSRAIGLFALTAALVLSPKWLSLLLWAAGKLPGWGRDARFAAGLAIDTLASIVMAPIMMAHQTRAVMETFLGRDAGWRPQVRDRDGLDGADIGRAAAPHIVLATLFLAANVLISPAMALWAAPVALSLMFAPQIEMWLAQRAEPNSAFFRYTQTPEEAPALAMSEPATYAVLALDPAPDADAVNLG